MKITNCFNKLESKGLWFFNLGILFLPSAFALGALLVLVAIFISIFNNKKIFFKDKFNYPLLICVGLFITSCLNNSIDFLIGVNKELPEFPYSSKEYLSGIWIDLFNWIPFLFAFWALQAYLNSTEKRFLFAKTLIIGTIPVLISCIGQYWFGWTEKLSIFNGLIIWYQKDIEMMSGLFSNPNYAGLWLAITWPFSYFLVFKDNNILIKKMTAISISITILYVTIMTSSRNALLGILVSCIFLIGIKSLYFAFFVGFLSFAIYFFSSNILPFETSKTITEYLPKSLIHKFTRFDIITNFARIDQWRIGLKAIFEKPIFGWGGGTFAFLYLLYGGLYKDLGPTHTHNFFLEISYNYGLPLALVLTLFIAYLFWRVFSKKLYLIFKKNNIDRTWITSAVVIIIFFITDMPYYDGRISLISWVLLSGLKCIGDEINL